MEAFKREEDFKMPEKPSAGLRVAVHDLERCEKHPDYEISMDAWHSPCLMGTGKTVCEVCLGGSVLARKKDNPQFDSMNSSEEISRKIQAMDFFRSGWITEGVKEYYYHDPTFHLTAKLIEDIKPIVYGFKNWVEYGENPNKFKKNLLDVADKLEALGL